MAIKIGSNITSMIAQRLLGEATDSLSKTYEKLSSGQRINKASDDAAGLAITETLNAKSRVFSRAVKNVSDGISVVAIADAAIGALTGITTRISELAEQSGNGTYTDEQRKAMDDEAQSLAEEYFRISRTTSFNGINLFDGSMQGLSIQAGEGTGGVLASSLGGKLGTAAFGGLRLCNNSNTSYDAKLGDLNGDGNLDIVTANVGSTVSVLLGKGDGSFEGRKNYETLSDTESVALGDVNRDGILDIVASNLSGDASVLLGNGDGTFQAKRDYSLGAGGPVTRSIALGDFNGDDILDIATANSAIVGASVLLGRGDGSFGTLSTFNTGTDSRSIVLGDLNNDNALDMVVANYGSANACIFLGNGDGTFNQLANIGAGASPSDVSLGDLNSDGMLDMVFANSGGVSSIMLGKGDGTFNAPTTVSASGSKEDLVDLNGDSFLDLAVVSGGFGVSVLLGNGNGSFGTTKTYSNGSFSLGMAFGDLDGDLVADLVTANGPSDISVLMGSTRGGISPILPFSLKTKADALQALVPMKHRLEVLALQRGVLGAFEARLGTAVANLTSSVENFKAAESRIRDADIAQESANLTRIQIVQQAASAVLAQANQQPALALTLLRNV